MVDKGFETYQAYTAMCLHFNPSNPYDYFKYNGKTKTGIESFRKSGWKWQFAALESKVDNVLAFLYSAFKSNDFSFLHQKQLFAHTRVHDLQTFGATYIEGLKRNVCQDIRYLLTDDRWRRLFTTANLYPLIHEEYDDQNIGLETVLCFHSFIHDIYKEDRSSDVVAWPSVCARMRSVAPFVVQLLSRNWFEQELREAFREGV